jgi:DNA-directed RNA polymerase specialized sigma24 family protein
MLIKVGMRSDDEVALQDFVVTRYPALRRSAFLMCGDWGVASRVAQDTLAHLVADGRRGNVTDPDAYAWAELMHDLVRRTGPSRREHLFLAAPDGDGAAPDGDGAAPDGDGAAPDGDDAGPDAVLTLDALHRLAPRCRAVLILRHWDGLSIEETADVLGLTDERAEAYEAAGLGAMDTLAGAR